MSTDSTQTVGASDSPALAALRVRCAGLGLPTWMFDAGGRLEAEPTEDGPAGAWLRCGPVRDMVCGAVAARLAAPHDAASRGTAERSWTMREVFPGCHLIAMDERQGRRLKGTVVAAALGPDVFQAPEFERACAAGQVDAAGAGRAMEPLACFASRGIDRLGSMLGWMRDDLVAAAKDRSSLAEHGSQLTEMYEQIGLLYRLGRAMNRLTTPGTFVRSACDELAATLPFGWVAIKFGAGARVAPGMEGYLYAAGTLPCPREEFDRHALAVLPSLEPAKWKLLPEGGGGALAMCCGGQVLAHPIARDGEVVGVLLAGSKTGLDGDITSFETQLLDAAADYVGVFLENAGLYADQHAMFVGTVQALTASIDAKDRYTFGHSERVATLARALALAAGLEEERAERVRISGLLHDVGKIGVPESVLCKAGRLTPEEFELIKLHPAIGHRILRDIPALEDVLPGVLSHHERWDGRGYPEGLAGEAIPRIARVLAVADSFDAMSSNRSYRAAMTREQVLVEMHRCAGSQFDPELARLFVTLDLGGYDAMVERHRGAMVKAA